MEIGFLLKKFISFFVEPFGFGLTLLIVGIFFVLKQKESRAKLFLFSSLFVFLLFSYPPFVNFLVQNLESQYPKYDYKQKIKYIHVLGSGHTTDKMQPISSQISSGGTKRVLDGVIIYKRTPDVKLIFTGYKGKTTLSNAEMNARLAEALGVNKKDIIINGHPTDTKEEAIFTKSIVGKQAFALVTSATHMPRAMMLFKSLGMHPIAAPTNFYKNNITSYLRAPNIQTFSTATIAMHEYIGIVWEKLKRVLK
jgi:uncharacterized SAM-binding protein YcdF (DUF218 family)